MLGCWYAGAMKVTVDLDQELYRAVKVEAARADRSVRDVLADAISAWLERVESDEDRASAEEALLEYRRDGGVAAADFFEHLAAGARATYGTEEPQPDAAARPTDT
jgi:plasmid stability protein